VGASRLILKNEVHRDSLPVEKYFPGAFTDSLPVGSVEASRFIARHPQRRVQHLVSLANIRAMVMHAARIESPGIYAVVEKPLAGYFRSLGIPLTELSETQQLPEYGDTANMAVKFSPQEIIGAADDPSAERSLLARFFRGARDNHGLGYYDHTLQRSISLQEEVAQGELIR
jgi:hypothetical protein